MPPLGPIKRKDLLRYLKQLGFEGPYAGGKHQFVIKGDLSLRVPNPHQADIGKELLIRILRQAGISRDEWEKL
jgi:predicted RNA binding protein YcfA (HicA-like mRNA interferase family)